MDSHTYSVEKLAVVETGRRRRWSDEEKLRIVTESLAGPRLASATARRYGISRGQLFTWRRELRIQPFSLNQRQIWRPRWCVTGAAPPVHPISILSASTPISQLSEAAAC